MMLNLNTQNQMRTCQMSGLTELHEDKRLQHKWEAFGFEIILHLFDHIDSISMSKTHSSLLPPEHANKTLRECTCKQCMKTYFCWCVFSFSNSWMIFMKSSAWSFNRSCSTFSMSFWGLRTQFYTFWPLFYNLIQSLWLILQEV